MKIFCFLLFLSSLTIANAAPVASAIFKFTTVPSQLLLNTKQVLDFTYVGTPQSSAPTVDTLQLSAYDQLGNYLSTLNDASITLFGSQNYESSFKIVNFSAASSSAQSLKLCLEWKGTLSSFSGRPAPIACTAPIAFASTIQSNSAPSVL